MSFLTVCVSVVCTYECDENSLELMLQAAVNCPALMLGTECVSSVRILHANHWPISTDPGIKFVHIEMWILSVRKCDGYFWLSFWLYLEWTTIQKWRVHLWSEYWGKKTTGLSSRSWGWMTQALNPDLEARKYSFNLGHTSSWKFK